MKHTTRVDARTIETKRRIQEELRQMIMEYKYSQVAVSELARRVGINRKTFYLHYETIESAFDELAAGIAQEIGSLSAQHIDAVLKGDYASFFAAYEDFLEQDKDFHKRLFCETSYRSINQEIQDLSCEALLDAVEASAPDVTEEVRLKVAFIAYGLNGIRRRSYTDTGSAPSADSLPIMSKIVNACWAART